VVQEWSQRFLTRKLMVIHHSSARIAASVKKDRLEKVMETNV
jgi:hypothetical protein